MLFVNKTHYINGLSIYEFEELWHKKKQVFVKVQMQYVFMLVSETYFQENLRQDTSN